MDGIINSEFHDEQRKPGPVLQLLDVVMGGGCALVTKQTGTSAMLASLAPCLAPHMRVLEVRPPLDLQGFLGQVVTQAGLDGSELERAFDALTTSVLGSNDVALLVHDAHLMQHEALRYVEFAFRANPRLRVVLAGKPELADIMALNAFAWLRARFVLHLALPDAPSPAPRPAPLMRDLPPRVARNKGGWLKPAGAGALTVGGVAAALFLVLPAFRESASTNAVVPRDGLDSPYAYTPAPATDDRAGAAARGKHKGAEGLIRLAAMSELKTPADGQAVAEADNPLKPAPEDAPPLAEVSPDGVAAAAEPAPPAVPLLPAEPDVAKSATERTKDAPAVTQDAAPPVSQPGAQPAPVTADAPVPDRVVPDAPRPPEPSLATAPATPPDSAAEPPSPLPAQPVPTVAAPLPEPPSVPTAATPPLAPQAPAPVPAAVEVPQPVPQPRPTPVPAVAAPAPPPVPPATVPAAVAVPPALPVPVAPTAPAAVVVPQPVPQPAPAPVPTAIAPAPVRPPAPAMSADMADMLIQRADAMLRQGDISAARLLYGRAASAGSGRAATAMGRTFDAAFLAQTGVVGLRPDPAQAMAWYRRAITLGDGDASTRLSALEAAASRSPLSPEKQR